MNTKPIYVFARWQAKAGQIETVLSLLTDVAQKSREEEGNLFYKIHQSTSDANIILLAEGYTSETAVSDHRNTKHFQDIVLGKIVPLLENREVTLTTLLSE